MDIILYKYNGESNRLDKTNYLHEPITLTGNARESIDKMSASLLLQYSGALIGYNYVYITELNRYYFIESDTIERTDIHRLTLKTDVLMTYKTAIKSSSGLVSRNENLYNTQIIDDRLRFLGYKSINTLKFPYSIRGSESFILAVNGGV